ncbi:MAG: stage II sporulation protein M [Segniliparus sp.]|uniref:stage II sporulation protein M n=1 Tax=Segniliparus sp. TaxID=2804064 RepID=UPI003F3D25BB
MDSHAFASVHGENWRRLESLLERRRTLRGDEVDELVSLYQRTATHLSMLRSAAEDPALIGRLSVLVARARSAVTGAHAPAWREFGRFWTVVFPVAAYRARWWWLGAAVFTIVVATATGWWVDHDPNARAAIAPPEHIQQLVDHDFENYYSEHEASAFATKVWLNNSWVAAQCLGMAALLGLPIPFVLFQNAVNVGVGGGLMFHAHKGGLFFGLILPHGLLELTAVFLAAGGGMRLGWSVIAPGRRQRVQALAEEGRSMIAIAMGAALVLLVSGGVEAFVTPSPLPTWARIGIGVVAESVLLVYVVALGRPAARAGETGDLENAPDYAPSA